MLPRFNSLLVVGCALAALLQPSIVQAGDAPAPSRDAKYWVAPERTPGPLRCAGPAATGVWVSCDRWPDGSDLRRFGEDAIRLCGARTDHEKCLAVYRWIRRWMIFPDKRVGPPTEKIAGRHHKRGFVDQGLKQLNVYGVHWCDGQVRVMEAVWRALGYRAEKVVRGGHTIAGCYYQDYDGQSRWHALDVSHSGILFDRSGRRLLSLDELSTRYYNFYYQWIFCPHNAWDDHRMELSLRPGERLERVWGNWGKPYQDNAARDDAKVPACERGPYPLDYGNGRWTYTPDLEEPGWMEGLAGPPVAMAAGKLQPAAPGKRASAEWDFRTPYIISDAQVRLCLFRRSPEDRISLHLSVDGGESFEPVWQCPSELTGRRDVIVPVCEKFTVTGEAEPPEGFHSPFGRYDYRLKLVLQAEREPADCRVDRISFETVAQQNYFALPQLQPGRNRITVRGSLPENTALKVTYVWDDPQGEGRKNVTLVETVPHTYEIIAAGERWEDCVCKSIAVEAVAATGEGNRTLIREIPSPIRDLLPMRPVEETATAWYQPRGDQLPPIDELVDRLERRKDLRESVCAAAMLADARAFDAVKRIAYEVDDPRVKNQALVALFVMDRRRARPVLFDLAAHKDRSHWDTHKNPSGDAAWIAATTVIGYMAAEAGWQEFLPLLIAALEHPAATPHWGPRYGLLRGIGRLGHGDEAAAEAIRGVLTDRHRDEHTDAKAVAALAAGQIGDPTLIPALRRYVDSSYEPLKHHAALSLSILGDQELAPTLRDWLRVIGDENYRGVAAEALGNLRDRDSVAALTAAAAAEPLPWVRDEIHESLEEIARAYIPTQ